MKSIKVTVISKKGQFFREKNRGDTIELADGDEYKKVVSFFQEKIGVTPSVAAPGVTHPSDATGASCLLVFTVQ